MINLENDGEMDANWWKQYHKDIEKAKRDFEKSGKIGGNPLGLPLDYPKNKIRKG